MPLPDRNVTWPPPAERQALDLYERWGAWYAGDPEALSRAYEKFPGLAGPSAESDGKVGLPQSARFLGGLIGGVVQRAFWGQPVSRGQLKSHKVHVPLAGDIATTSADLLFGETPAFELLDDKGKRRKKNDPTQQALDEINEEANLAAVLLEAGEIAAAFGGAYIRVRWDTVISPDAPLYDAIPPDAAVPEWRAGRLSAVTFWRNLERVDGKWWRHLERHEPGRVLHGLFMSGDETRLGRPMALTDHDETAGFAMLVDAGDGQTVTTGADGLTAEYLPNMRPNRSLRGSPLGRSDYDGGVAGVLDALDEAWTSWLRDLRIGKGRLIVPRQYVQSRGRGRGAVFDPDQEVFEAIDAVDNGEGNLKLSNVQFAIRVDEHSRTCRALTEQAVRGAGYAAQTFGESDAIAATATEVNAREGRSMRTRSKKLLYARGPVGRIAYAGLQVWLAKLAPARVKDVKPARPAVNWPDGVAVDQESIARTLQMFHAAEAISTYEKVKIRNPDWEEDQIQAEVDRILKEKAPPQVVEPGSTGTGQGLDGPASGDDDEMPAGSGNGPAGEAGRDDVPGGGGR
jgi:hypothetical protein